RVNVLPLLPCFGRRGVRAWCAPAWGGRGAAGDVREEAPPAWPTRLRRAQLMGDTPFPAAPPSLAVVLGARSHAKAPLRRWSPSWRSSAFAWYLRPLRQLATHEARRLLDHRSSHVKMRARADAAAEQA